MSAQSKILLPWGKLHPFHPLFCHMVDVGSVLKALISTSSFKSLNERLKQAMGYDGQYFVNWIALLGMLHDIGKCATDFQGKAGKEVFQPLKDAGYRMRSKPIEGFRHEALSAEIVYEYLTKNKKWNRRATKTICEVIRGHHGNFFSNNPIEEKILQESWSDLRESLINSLENICQVDIWSPLSFPDASVVGTIFSGLLVLADWMASNEDLFPRMDAWKQFKEQENANYALISYEFAKKAINRLGFSSVIDWSNKKTFQDTWPIFQSPRAIQLKSEEIGFELIKPGMIIIEAPMGDGKTEAAIHLTVRWIAKLNLAGMYVALPTMATSNQMYGRVKDFIERHDETAKYKVSLVHGMAWILDSLTPEMLEVDQNGESNDLQENEDPLMVAYDWFKPKKRALLAPYAVGTVDQALMAALNVKFGYLRLLGLSTKVLIIDEIHAYDTYMSQIIVRLVQWASVLGMPIILLSATLPMDKKQLLINAYFDPHTDSSEVTACSNQMKQLSPYPLITIACKDNAMKEIGVPVQVPSKKINLLIHQNKFEDFLAIAKLAIECCKTGKCVCVLANTVHSAQMIYETILQILGNQVVRTVKEEGVLVKLFHARFITERRLEIEKEVLELFDKRSIGTKGKLPETLRPKTAILVATQVVEQSLDLDFDEMISEIAPVDLLLQRAGRLHRHERPDRLEPEQAKFHVLLPDLRKQGFGRTARVYNKYLLFRTVLAIAKKNTISVLQDMRSLIESVYDMNHPLEMHHDITEEMLQEARIEYDKQQEIDKNDAGKYLIPKPSRSLFSLATAASTYDEDEGGMKSYLIAKTRKDDWSIQVLVLDENSHPDLIQRKTKPNNTLLRELLLRSVSIPQYWIKNLQPQEGYQAITKCPPWLLGTFIIRMKEVNGKKTWKGTDPDGKQVTIIYDHELGMKLHQDNEHEEVIENEF